MRPGSRPRLEAALLVGHILLGTGAAARAQEPASVDAAPAPPPVLAPAPVELPTAPQLPDAERPSPTRPAPDDWRPSYTRRAYARGAMQVTAFPPTTYSEFGGEYAPSGGVWAGGGLTIVNSLLGSYIPSFRVHGTLGYSGRWFALGADLGGGAGLSFFLLGSVDVGLALRFGRTGGVHANLLVYWYAFPPISFPAGGELTLRAPVGARSWFTLELRGDMRMGPWGSALFGGLIHLSSEPRGSTYLSLGLGAAWQYPYPGALVQLGYEYRH